MVRLPRSSSTRSRTVLGGLGLALAIGAGAPPTLAAGSGAVSVQTVFENTPISVNLSDAVGYELTNSTAQTETVSFTDTLPAGVVVDNPAALTDTNGTGSCVVESSAANPGSGTVSLSVLVPNSSAAGPVCTISVGVVPGSPSSADAPLLDSYSGLSATPATSSLTASRGGLVVMADPALTVTAPQNGQAFALGAVYDAGFACATTDPLDSVDSFFGTDDRGNQIASGEPIDTVDPGSHTLDIECYSAAGGGYVSQTVDYTVGSYGLSRVRTTGTGQVAFRTLVPAGKLVAKVLEGTTVLGTTTTTVSGAESLITKVGLSRAGLRALRAARARTVRVELQTSFTPAPVGTGDAEVTPTSTIKLIRANIRLRLTAALLQLR